MAKWIKNCQICNDGLCIRFEELKKNAHKDRRIAAIMAEEANQAYPELKDEFSADRIRDRYRYHMKKKMGEIPPADDSEEATRDENHTEDPGGDHVTPPGGT
jgi:hypothetical protein